MGGVITQSFPTELRTFHKSVLAREADLPLWTEWTAAEKAAWLGKAHPVPHLDPANAGFISRWKSMMGGEYFEQTGLFGFRPTWIDGERFGPADLTLEDAVKAFNAWGKGGNIAGMAYRCGRLFLPPVNYTNPVYQENGLVLQYNQAEYVFLAPLWDSPVSVAGNRLAISTMPNLRAVVGRLLSRNQVVALTDAPKLEFVRFAEIPAQVDAGGCPALNGRSLRWMAETNAYPGGSVIALHPLAYARLTDEILAIAEQHNITFAEA